MTLLCNPDEAKEEGVVGRTKNMSVDDFTVMRIIGRGGFGEVRIVRKKSDGKVYAMKAMKKNQMLRRRQVQHAMSER